MGLPPKPATARLAACTTGPLHLCTYCVYTHLSLSLFMPFILYFLSPLNTLSPSYPHLYPFGFFLPPLIAVLHFVSSLFFFFLPFFTLRHTLISLAVAVQLILLQYSGLLFTSHKSLLPCPPASPGNADG